VGNILDLKQGKFTSQAKHREIQLFIETYKGIVTGVWNTAFTTIYWMKSPLTWVHSACFKNYQCIFLSDLIFKSRINELWINMVVKAVIQNSLDNSYDLILPAQGDSNYLVSLSQLLRKSRRPENLFICLTYTRCHCLHKHLSALWSSPAELFLKHLHFLRARETHRHPHIKDTL